MMSAWGQNWRRRSRRIRFEKKLANELINTPVVFFLSNLKSETKGQSVATFVSINDECNQDIMTSIITTPSRPAHGPHA